MPSKTGAADDTRRLSELLRAPLAAETTLDGAIVTRRDKQIPFRTMSVTVHSRTATPLEAQNESPARVKNK